MTNKTVSYGYGQGSGNQTLIEQPNLCTLETCDLSLSSYNYIPTVAGNSIFAAIFGIYIIVQLGLGIKHKTWGYMTAMLLGLFLELLGYVGRILLSDSPFNEDYFLLSLICLTIAPALLTASIYLCLGRIVTLYGENLSFFKARTYTIVFCTFDFICLVLQAVGGAIASLSETREDTDLGRNIMIAGLVIQVVALAAFLVAGTDFAIRVWKGRGMWNEKYIHIVSSLLFKSFLGGLYVATITILIRSIYRTIELWGGFDSALFEGHEAIFMILEGLMIIIACACLTFPHPGVAFQGAYQDANFRFRTKKDGEHTKTESSSDVESGMKAEPTNVRRK